MSTFIDKYLIQSHFKTSAIPIICLCIAMSLLDPAEYIYIYMYLFLLGTYPVLLLSCILVTQQNPLSDFLRIPHDICRPL